MHQCDIVRKRVPYEISLNFRRGISKHYYIFSYGMLKNTSKFMLPLVLLLVVGAIMAYSSVSATQQRNKEMEAERIQAAELAQEKAKEDAEKRVYLIGEFDPSAREDFAPVPTEYNFSGYKIYLRKEALYAFLEMAEAAKKDKIELAIVSAARNFDYQKDIWNKKWGGATLVDGKNLSKSIPDGQERFLKILEYSAVPGTSRHHWGTDIDVNMTVPYYFETEKGKQIYAWLVENAFGFGFCQVYTLKGSLRPTGYNEEKWHWSYLPLAKTFTKDYKDLITAADIAGFDGDEYVPSLNLINDYVLG